MEEWIKEKVRYFREQVEGLNISEEIKKAIPSRCQISDKYVKLCNAPYTYSGELGLKSCRSTVEKSNF